MRFETITNVRQGPPVTMGPQPSWFPGGPYQLLAPTPPPGGVRVLPDNLGPVTSVIKPPRGKSWKRVQIDGDIKMTPYSHITLEETHSTFQVERYGYTFNRATFMRSGCTHKTDNQVVTPLFRNETRWTQVYSMHDFLNYKVSGNTGSLEGEISDIQNELLGNVVSDQYSGFDLLTEFKEFPETLEFILGILRAARHPLKGMRDLIEEYKKATGRENVPLGFGAILSPVDRSFMDRWMQYRYAVMPLYYSIRDALELIQGMHDKFKTDRSKRILPVYSDDPYPANEDHVFHVVSGTVTIRCVGKSSYASPGLRLSDLLMINPFVTAWEVIPYSFVVDWFLNVGTWLIAQTGGLRDEASQRSFCISTKRDLIERRVAFFTTTDGGRFDSTYTHNAGCGNVYHQNDHIDETVETHHQFTFYKKRVQSYERVLRQPTDVRLDLSFSMNWKRWVDLFVIGTNLVSNELRKLHLRR